MKYNKLIAISALLYGAEAVNLKSEFLNADAFLQQGDMSLNQRKLYAFNLKQQGTNIQLFDTNKSEAQNNKEYDEMNMHLLQM